MRSRILVTTALAIGCVAMSSPSCIVDCADCGPCGISGPAAETRAVVAKARTDSVGRPAITLVRYIAGECGYDGTRLAFAFDAATRSITPGFEPGGEAPSAYYGYDDRDVFEWAETGIVLTATYPSSAVLELVFGGSATPETTVKCEPEPSLTCMVSDE